MFALFGTVGGWIAYAVIICIALAAIKGFDLSRQHIGAEKQRIADAPVMSLCDGLPQPTGLFSGKLKPADCARTLKTGLDAIAANDHLRERFKTLEKERDDCSANTRLYKAASDRADAERKKREAEEQRVIADITPEIEEQVALLGLPTPQMTCEQKLARRNAMLKKTAAQRARDFPMPPGGVSPASDDVTIRPPTK